MHSGSVVDLRLTRNQHLVLSVLEESDRPLTAYRILDELREAGLNAPLQIYRALEKLVELGRVHRLESLNAFVACCHAVRGHVHNHITAFQICKDCGRAQEFHDERVDLTLQRQAKMNGFEIRHSSLEIHGVCEECRTSGRPIIREA